MLCCQLKIAMLNCKNKPLVCAFVKKAVKCYQIRYTAALFTLTVLAYAYLRVRLRAM